jgi:Leucine-rich repeat (LRR) protein
MTKRMRGSLRESAAPQAEAGPPDAGAQSDPACASLCTHATRLFHIALKADEHAGGRVAGRSAPHAQVGNSFHAGAGGSPRHDLQTLFTQLAHIIYPHLPLKDALALRLACASWREVYAARVVALRYRRSGHVQLDRVLSRVFTRVVALSISLGGFTALPAPASALRQLSKLDLSGNTLPSAQLAQLSALTGLTELSLSFCGLRQTPPALAALTRLKRLNLGSNLLASFASFASLGSLESLNLTHNRWVGSGSTASGPRRRYSALSPRMAPGATAATPPEQRALPPPHPTPPTRLRGTCRRFEAFPEVLALASLRTLIIFHNQIASLPAGISALSKLALLNAFSNELLALPPAISALGALTKLDVSRNHLAALPPQIGGLLSLLEILLLQNRLRELPAAICSLSALRKLDCSSNCLERLPGGIGALTALACLNVSQNRLEDLPPSITRLQGLERLALGRNEVRDPRLPAARRACQLPAQGPRRPPSPSHHTPTHNSHPSSFLQLRSVPDTISRLSRLTSLDLSCNKIHYLPSSVADLRRLRVLDISSAELREVPERLRQLEALEELNISGNRQGAALARAPRGAAAPGPAAQGPARSSSSPQCARSSQPPPRAKQRRSTSHPAPAPAATAQAELHPRRAALLARHEEVRGGRPGAQRSGRAGRQGRRL